MTFPTFNPGQALPASDLNAIGLWLIKTQTIGTGVTSVTVTDAFSADFDLYRITVTGGVGSTNAGLSLRMGTDNSSNYWMVLPYWVFGGVAGRVDNAPGQEWRWAGVMGTNYARMNIDVFNPFQAQFTTFAGPYIDETLGGVSTGVHKLNTSYTSFTVLPQPGSGGTITGGTIRVYGYRR